VSFEIFNALREPNETVISYFLREIKEDYFEGCELDYGWYTSFANVWRDTIGNRRLRHGGSSYYEAEEGIDMSNIINLPKRVYQALTKDFEGIGVFTMADDETEFYEIPNARIKDRVMACVQQLSEAGYQIDPEAKFRYGVFEKSDRKAAAKRKKKQILISENCLKVSDEVLTAVIVENAEYLNLKCKKENPGFYEHFVNLYTSLLLSKKEIEA
jgi:hypothetical protein